MKNASRFRALFAFGLIMIASFVDATEGVSPGAPDRLAVVNNPCPTFSWQDDEAAKLYEIVAYSLHTDESPAAAELAAEAEVLYSQVPAGATSWTPSAEQCFAPGGRYVWFVRPVMELAADQAIEAGEWSAGRYFTVPAGPTDAEVARAVEVLRMWEAMNGGGSLSLSSATAAATAADAVAAPASGAGAGGGAGAIRRKSVPTASAAIRGGHTNVSGEAYGVVGTTASYDGAGVAAANLEGGPDLVLDGSADGDVDTLIYENVLTRSSPNDQVFLFHNGGGGTLDLYVHGTLNGDGLNVQYGTVIDDAGNWLGVGDTVPCPGCVESSDIADGTIIDNDLADDAVTEEKIEHGAVGTTTLQNNSVTSFKIADGTVSTADLADDSVSGAKIADGAVDAAALRNNAVTTDKIAAATITGADIDPASWVYVSKSQLYEREASVSLAGTGGLPATAYCDDANDLPIAASCRVSSAALRLYGENAVDWTSAVDPAGWTCDFYNDLGGTHLGTVKLTCISVP